MTLEVVIVAIVFTGPTSLILDGLTSRRRQMLRGQLCKLLKHRPDHPHKPGSLHGLVLQAGDLELSNSRISIRTIGRVQGDPTAHTAVFEPDPRLKYVLAELCLFDNNLSTPTSPFRVATISSVSVEAEIETLAICG